jgi:hypothetical protein
VALLFNENVTVDPLVVQVTKVIAPVGPEVGVKVTLVTFVGEPLK